MRARLLSKSARCLLLASVFTSALLHAQTTPSVGTTHRLRGHAYGLLGAVTLELQDKSQMVVDQDGELVFSLPLTFGPTFSLRVLRTSAGQVCVVTPREGVVKSVEVTLTCYAAEGPVARPTLPALNARQINPLLGRVVLVLTEDMAEPPTGALKLEAHDGEKWVDTGIVAPASYKPQGREWSFVLASRAFPVSRLLRVTVIPSAGRDTRGRALAKTPIQWTFTTGTNPLAKRATGELKGGCPADVANAAAASAPAVPCERP